MADGEFAQTFFKEIREFGARGDAVEIRRIFLFRLFEVETVVVRVVKEVTLNAPRFVIYLFPHGARLNIDLPPFKLERAKAGLGRASSAGPIVG